MHARVTRRTFSAGVLATVVGTTVGRRHAGAQDSTGAGASPVAGEELFAGVTLQPGIVPTIYGDISLPERVERIVTVTDGAVDAMIAVGIEPVGVTASSNAESVAAYLLDNVSDNVTYVGGWSELDLEAIVALAPDIILGDRYLAEDSYALLSQIAPTIATGEIAGAGPESLQQWEYETLVLGFAVGREAEAKQAILDLRARAAALQPELGDHLGQSVVVFRPQAEFPVVMSHHWFTGVLLTWCGLRGNELTEAMEPPHSGNTISLERLDLLDADWLFAATRNQEMVEALQSYMDNPAFSTLSAVQNGQVAQVPGDLWSGATGVLAGHAMIDDIQRILVDGDYGV